MKRGRRWSSTAGALFRLKLFQHTSLRQRLNPSPASETKASRETEESAENTAVGLLVKTNHQCFTNAGGGCSQISRRAQHRLHGICGWFSPDGELIHLFALRDDQSRYTLEQGSGVSLLQLLAGRHLVFHLNVICLQKLGGTDTASSPTAVVVPIHLRSHISLFLVLVEPIVHCIESRQCSSVKASDPVSRSLQYPAPDAK